MNIQSNQRMGKAAFIAWNAVTEARCELVAGSVVEAPRITRGQAMIVTNLLVSLRESLDRPQWEVLKSFGVEAGPDTVRYPDIVVDRAGGDGGDYTTTAPALLIEVLSPETATTDLGDKAAEYLRIPGLLAYLVLSQDEPKAWVHARAGAQFTPGPRVVSGKEAIISVAALQLELPMADIYAGIKTD